MSNDAHVPSFADAGFGMGGGVRTAISMMFTTMTITTRMRGGGG